MKIGTMDEYADDMSVIKLIDYTDNGKCSSCGNCCSNELPLSENEIREIERYIQKHGIKEYKNLLPTAKPMIDMTCPFRNNSTQMCMIYSIRPEICRRFICNDANKAKQNKERLYKQNKPVFMRMQFYGHW